jgi:GNAT superfamily N-acetyltransferase
MEFVYSKLSQADKHIIKALTDKEEVVGFLIFVIPSQETYEKIKEQHSEKYLKWWIDEYMEKPYVDYSFIEPEQRNKGYGKALYKAVSLFLKKEFGYKLYSSLNQSKEVKGLWASLRRENDPRFIVTEEYLEAAK